MPKSKRNRVVSLTKTAKKGKGLKTKSIDEVRLNADKYERMFLFSYSNMRNSKLQALRDEWQGSRLFFGKKQVVAAGFGRDRENEYKEDLHKISDRLHGNRALLFTDRPKDEVIKYFKLFSETAWANTGDIATETVKLDAGPLEQFSHALEPRLRDLGLTTSLKKGVIHLEKDFIVCEEGEPITADGAAILRLLELELSEFKIMLEAMWSSQNGYVELEPPEALSRKRKMLMHKRQDQQDKAARKAGKEVTKGKKKSKAKKAQQAPVEMEQEVSEEEDEAELESEDELEAQLN